MTSTQALNIIFLWFLPVVLLLSWFPFWVLLVFLSYWLLIPKVYLFQWVQLELTLGAHLRLLCTEIWMLWLFYLCILGFQETIPLDQASVFFWLRYFLLIPISIFMLYRTFRPRSSWLSQKYQQAQDYVQKDILSLLGNYLEYHGGDRVYAYLSWLNTRDWNKNRTLFYKISIPFLLIPLSLLTMLQFWAFFMAKDLSWSLRALPLLMVPRFHALMLDFFLFFIQASTLGNEQMLEEKETTEQCFDHTQSSLEESLLLYESYGVFLRDTFPYFWALRWSLILIFAWFLLGDSSLCTLGLWAILTTKGPPLAENIPLKFCYSSLSHHR